MVLFKKLFKILMILVFLIFIGVFFFIQAIKPSYKGELKLNSLSDKVTVFYDDYGIPHINAQNEEDAFVAFGYVHAQDRLWQMEVMRRIAAGRLSEIFGKDLVRVDKFMSGLGIEEASSKTIQELDKNSNAYKLSKAYLKGVNQFIKEGVTPLEFYLLGINKETYSLKDIYNVFGYMSFSFATAHKTDPLLNEIKEKLGGNYLKELEVLGVNNTFIKSNKKVKPIEANLSAAIGDIMNKLPVSSFIGSNSWVLGAGKTKNGKVIFANDPHINFGQPSVWYQSHIKTPNYEIYGFNIALMPFPLLGHNTNYAYGLTMFQNDDVDFYVEQNNPENPLEYKTPKGYKSYDLIDKKIKVKGGDDVVYQIKVSNHGPVMNDLIEQINDERPISMQWIYTKYPSKLLDACYEMSHANSLTDFKKGVSKIHAPGLNVMYGDVQDNISWFASAKLYKYRDSLDTKVYLDGSSGKDEIVRFLEFDENPQATNPEWDYVYSANNQPDSINGELYPGYYSPEDRAKRIISIIDAKNDLTKEDVVKMITDVTSSTAPELSMKIVENCIASRLSNNEKEALQVLKKWDGNYYKNSVAPTLYNRFLYEFLKNTFKDELGVKGFNVFMKGGPLHKNMLGKQLNKKQSIWWDDVSTENIKEDKKEIVTKSLKEAVSFLENQLGKDIKGWQWKKVLKLMEEMKL